MPWDKKIRHGIWRACLPETPEVQAKYDKKEQLAMLIRAANPRIYSASHSLNIKPSAFKYFTIAHGVIQRDRLYIFCLAI
ncbi:hypothetical protein GCM10009102_08040 [Sphingomonas insulae]|uniref:Uncharacterized protein n=1 Tax=Sphingomonas insulae TaxID=424800 RepID=A0ABP3SVI1_9SPHN